jgi:hypothetical protein
MYTYKQTNKIFDKPTTTSYPRRHSHSRRHIRLFGAVFKTPSHVTPTIPPPTGLDIELCTQKSISSTHEKTRATRRYTQGDTELHSPTVSEVVRCESSACAHSDENRSSSVCPRGCTSTDKPVFTSVDVDFLFVIVQTAKKACRREGEEASSETAYDSKKGAFGGCDRRMGHDPLPRAP